MNLFTPFTIQKRSITTFAELKLKKEKQLRIHSLITFLEIFIGRDLISFSTDLKMSVRGLWLED